MVMGGLALLGSTVGGCGEESSAGPTTSAPQAVAPVEVTADTVDTAEPGAEDEVTQLRARVAELERQLAEAQGTAPPSGTETAPVPVPVPGEGETAAPTTGTETASAGSTTGDGAGGGSTGTTSSGRRARERDPSLLGALLGDEEGGSRRPRTNTDQDSRDLRLPNPANILLGE
jgi:hypothetical protein